MEIIPHLTKRLGIRQLHLGFLSISTVMAAAIAPPRASLEDALQARRDVWGEAAMSQPNGASYAFFAELLPPPRYVNADFRYYPIVLARPARR